MKWVNEQKIFSVLVCKNLNSRFSDWLIHLILEVSLHSWLLWPTLGCLPIQKLPGGCPKGCPEAAWRLLEAAQRLHEGCSEAIWRLPKGLPNRGKQKWIDLCSIIHSWSIRSVPLVRQTFWEVGQNNSWKCKVLLLCNTKALRQIMMSWCLQYGLISASKYVPSFDIQ